jgi:hypothetical protein
MKRCPSCGQTYNEPDLNFCLNDGELLTQAQDSGYAGGGSRPFSDDAPPTIMMNAPRATNPTGWAGGSSPPSPYQQNTTPAYQAPQFGMAQISRLDQTLPTVSLVLGIFSLIFVCCYGGLWLGIPAAIVGFMGMRNADSDPSRFGGRGLAIAGLILGIITFIMSMMILVLGLAGNAIQP